ncbi:GntR family transcriptional regulator [Salipaludibacillus aurantiacus]|uniref:GntR family transcriptional regulator n=1 Tax=Salipaludibacillus aurantiacus TaxID=1601833 RepID=A0A1H9URU1_9BACI|nr:GntR family transcriptional regulator [Salipaludibacillus aurantiacus]SES11767.1 GntR family transcriptional regulator [Salipaludibacillus aurantiacus]
MSLLNHNKGAVPLYQQLKEIIKDKIENGVYEVGEKIETEKELQEIYELSRITVRQALNELVNEGYLHRQRGKGTVVLGQKLFHEQVLQVKSFTEEMNERGYKTGTSYIDVSQVKASAEVARNLALDEGDDVIQLIRVRTANGIPIVVFDTYLSMKTGIKMADLETISSLYDFLTAKGINIHYVDECFEVVTADKRLASFLDVKSGFPLMLRTRQTYSTDHFPIEYTKAYYHSKLYRFNLRTEGK